MNRKGWQWAELTDKKGAPGLVLLFFCCFLDSRRLEGNWDCYLRPHLMRTNPPRCFDVVFLHFSSWAWDVSDSSLGRALRFLAQAPDILCRATNHFGHSPWRPQVPLSASRVASPWSEPRRGARDLGFREGPAEFQEGLGVHGTFVCWRVALLSCGVSRLVARVLDAKMALLFAGATRRQEIF